MDTCKNCANSVCINGRWLCVFFGCGIKPDEDKCARIERRFKNEVPNKTVVHTSEVVVKRV